MTHAEARALLPPEEQDMSDADLSTLLGQLYQFADLSIDIFLERRKVGVPDD